MLPIFRRALLAAAVCATPALAQSFENLDRLDQRVAAALGAAVGEPGGARAPIDRRLRLQPCPEPATIDAPILDAVAVRCPALGWRIRVPLAASATPAAAAPQARVEPLIHRGDQVTVIARTASFTVSTTGVADQNGAPGDRIRVRMDNRRAPLIGEVTPEGRVALPGFN